MGGLFRWNVWYVLHTMSIPSFYGMLVYRLALLGPLTLALCPLRPSFSLLRESSFNMTRGGGGGGG